MTNTQKRCIGYHANLPEATIYCPVPGLLLLLLLALCIHLPAQTLLVADGPGDTYELINGVMAPGYDVVESPDCSHPSFGRHIDEIWDDDLQTFVFRFHLHLSPDDDRCLNSDRQRNEIKAYDHSPDNLTGTEGETVVYIWKFKLDQDFQPSNSFTPTSTRSKPTEGRKPACRR